MKRLGYRIAYVLLVLGSHVLRPRMRGVKCLLVDGDEVLLVRHSYGPGRWDLPGGFCRRRESFEATARRELREELGVESARCVELGGVGRRIHGRHETVHAFRVEVDRAQLRPDRAEIEETRWVAREALPQPCAEIVAPVLAMERSAPGLPGSGQG